MINEKLSAYIDGEASPEETENLLAALKRDADLRDSYSRQQWLRHALRENSPVATDAGFSARVMAGLENESIDTDLHPRVVSIPTHAKVANKAPKSTRWQGPVAGMAIAASVVGALVLVGNPLVNEQTTPEQVATVSTLATAPVTNTQTPSISSNRQVAAASRASQSRPVNHWAVSDPVLEEQLNGYLLEHDGVARGYGLSGATPSFVRVATYGATQ